MSRPATYNNQRSIDSLLQKYATQLTAALFLIVATTGALMFFHLFKVEVEGIHEWLGLGFAVAAILHLLRNRRPLSLMLAQPRARALIAAVVVVSVGVIALSPPKGANPFRQATQRVMAAPIRDAAPALGVSADDAVSRLQKIGVTDAAPDKSIEALARQHGKNPAQLLSAVMAAQATQETQAAR